jgi:kynurenine formamidase
MKKVIDLTMPIFSGMEVYPGDPEVYIKPLFSYDNEGYVISQMNLGNHTGTHLDVPSHMIKDGKTLSDYPLDYFFGKAIIVKSGSLKSLKNSGKYHCIILDNVKVNESVIDQMVNLKVKLVGFGYGCNWTIPLIKKLLSNNILLVGKLVNLDKLPNEFYFSAFPLNIVKGNGSPVRAVAYI